MYLSRYNHNSLSGLGKKLVGSMVEQNPLSSPGYYITTFEFAEGRGPKIGELPQLDEKIREALKEKYGNDTLELGYLKGQVKGKSGEVVLTPQRLRKKEYVFGSLNFKTDRVCELYPEDMQTMTDDSRASRVFCITWLKKTVNIDKNGFIPNAYTISKNEDGSMGITPSENKEFVLKKAGLIPKPMGKVSFRGQTHNYVEWYDPEGKLVYTTGTAQDGTTQFYTPDEMKNLSGLGDLGAWPLWLKVGLVTLGVAAIAFFFWPCRKIINEKIACVDPKTKKEVRMSVLACLLLGAQKGASESFKKIAKGIGIGLAITIPVYAFFKWGLPAIKKYKEQKQIEEAS